MLAVYRPRHPLKNYFDLRRDPIAFLSEVARAGGDFVRFRIGLFPYVLVNDPALVREALVDKSETLVIKGGASAGLARLIGRGILTNRGNDWRTSRNELQPLFHQNALKSYLPIMVARIAETLARWRSEFAGTPIPIHRELLALSCRITCSTLFHYLPTLEEAGEFAEAIRVLQFDGVRRYMAGGDYTPWLPLPSNLRVGRAKATLRGIAQRAAGTGANPSVDEIQSILFAGTESPVNTLCFALKLLEDHPQWLAKLRAQAASGGPVSWEEVERFDVFAQVMSEAIRLYPAGWAFERVAAEPVTLGGERLAKGTRLLFSPYLLHRHPRFWREPQRFDPTRFATGPSSVEGVPKYGYLPFGAGPRSCIGSRLALAEMRLTLGALVSQCRWQDESGAVRLDAEGSFKIRLSRPLRLKMEFA